ncbi:MAG TPA: MFS transporter [Microvirga sp.]|nr:MFS transporter [Microvirga sp.]
MTASDPALPHRAIVGLAIAQIVGWGTSYYVPSVLAPEFRDSLGLSQEAVFGGITIMLLVGAAAAPATSRLIERRGARAALILGSALLAVALFLLSQAQGLWSYALGWVVVGLATPAALTQGAFSALAEIAGPGARRAIGLLLLITGFAATVFWPLTAWLESLAGWRGTLLLYAAMNLVLCVPLAAKVVPRLDHARAAKPAAALPEPALPAVHPIGERAAFALCAIAFSAAGIVSAGLGPLMVLILSAFGLPDATAVGISALVGPAAVAARVGEVVLGPRVGIMAVALAATTLMTMAIGLPLVAGTSAFIAVLFVVGYAMSAGTMTVVRAVMPLTLFGRERYARLLGRLAVPQNAVLAVSPMVLASVMSRTGPDAVLWIALAAAILSLGAITGLAILLNRPEVDRAP